MTTKQSQNIIKYDKLNEIYTCNINSKCVSSETLVDMVKHIGNIHNYDCWFIRDIDEYIEDLEKFASISINYDF